MNPLIVCHLSIEDVGSTPFILGLYFFIGRLCLILRKIQTIEDAATRPTFEYYAAKVST
jgi:hypothetical protein